MNVVVATKYAEVVEYYMEHSFRMENSPHQSRISLTVKNVL